MKNKERKVLVIILAVLITFSMTMTAGAEDVQKNSMRIGVTKEIDSLSPFISYSSMGYEVFSLLYDPLVGINENLDSTPDIATEWSLSDDQLVWTFKLRDDVKWSDGEPLTSNDVKFTYDLISNSGLGLYSGYLEGITSVECPDDYTVVITTEEPKANMLLNSTPIIPEHIWADVDEEDLETWGNDAPVGTGPFKFSEFKKGEYLKLVANEDYFGTKPSIDELIFVLYANTDVMTQALKLGEIDAATNISPVQLEQLKGEGNIDAISAVGYGFTQLSFNSSEDPSSKGNKLLLDKNIKKAIEYSIDKKKILNMVYGGQGTEGTTLIPPDGFYHYEPSEDELRSYNVEKANELLDSSGYMDSDGDGIREDKDGNKLSFVFSLRAENAQEDNAGQIIASMAKEVGINLDVELIDDGVLIDKIYSSDFDMFIWGWGTDLDPTTILAVMSTDQIGNLSDCNYSNEDYDNLLKVQQSKMDKTERQSVVWDMQKIIYEDAPYIILLYDNDLQAVRTDKWTNWKRIPEDGGYFFNLTNYNYLNVKPTGEAVSAQGGENTDSGKSNSGMIALVTVIVIGVLYFIFKKKNKK
ncbi:MAG: ABC transporter substrate-binding protein [Sedimentibacter sp.]